MYYCKGNIVWELETETDTCVCLTCLVKRGHLPCLLRTLHSSSQVLSGSIVNGYITKQNQQALAPYKHTFKELNTSYDIILRENTILIPSSLQSKAVPMAHKGHQGLLKAKQYAREHNWFPGIDRKLTITVEECLTCQAVTSTRQQEPFKMTGLPNGPWERLRADAFGLLPSKEYILVLQCLYSCFPAVEIVTSTSASAIILAMDKIMTSFRIPYKLGTDNGLPFNGQDFANFAKRMSLELTRATPYVPWANGTVEHFMRNLGKVLKTSYIDDHNWKTTLQCFLHS